MRKISMTFVLVAAILCLTVSALAAGLVFSPKVDADKLADEALLEEYGITPEMLTFFSRTSSEEDGAFTVTYDGVYAFSYVLGRYTVTVKGGKADASWSWDGTDTSDGFNGVAWGAEQLAEICRENQNGTGITRYANNAKRIAWEHDATVVDSGSFFNEAEAEALMEKEAREAETALAAAKLSIEEMEAIAREAIALRYAFDEEASKCLGIEPDDTRYLLFGDDELPCCEFFFYLGYQDGYKGPAGRGIYYAAINAENGTVEDVSYDSTLGGEG
ncbi:MAG: hypothetical protein IJ048_13310 [Clostridia bacterium]|nr:hypothetical protein [Clostridia bacterium]